LTGFYHHETCYRWQSSFQSNQVSKAINPAKAPHSSTTSNTTDDLVTSTGSMSLDNGSNGNVKNKSKLKKYRKPKQIAGPVLKDLDDMYVTTKCL
jgi:hypothetical protein